MTADEFLHGDDGDGWAARLIRLARAQRFDGGLRWYAADGQGSITSTGTGIVWTDAEVAEIQARAEQYREFFEDPPNTSAASGPSARSPSP